MNVFRLFQPVSLLWDRTPVLGAVPPNLPGGCEGQHLLWGQCQIGCTGWLLHKAVCAVVPMVRRPNMPTVGTKGPWLGPPLGTWCLTCLHPKWAFLESAQVPVKPFLPSAFVGQCQDPTTFQSTRPPCLLASVTVVLEHVSFKLGVGVTLVTSLRSYAALSPTLVSSRDSCLLLSRE